MRVKSAAKMKNLFTDFFYFQRSLSSPDGLVSSMPDDATSRLHLASLGQVGHLFYYFFASDLFYFFST